MIDLIITAIICLIIGAFVGNQFTVWHFKKLVDQLGEKEVAEILIAMRDEE